MTRSISTPLAVLALAFAALPALAETAAPVAPAVDATTASPYEYVASGKKAARDAEATAADPAGAKVVGGQLADQGEWPWQVALTMADRPMGIDAQFCGGSIVLDEWILTAAHCVLFANEDGSSYALQPQELSIVVGTNKLDGSGDRVPVEAIYYHPNYTVDQFDYDIALVKLARKPTAPYKTIEVPDAAFGDILQKPGITTIVTGWGLQNGGTPSADLREAQIQMLDREMCNTAMMEVRAEDAAQGFSYAVTALGVGDDAAYPLWDQLVAAAPLPMTENMICSGTFEGGKTSCSGDSGGPLVVPLEDGSYIQAGIVSWGLTGSAGHGCEEKAMFSAYTNVSKFVPWLNEVISANP